MGGVGEVVSPSGPDPFGGGTGVHGCREPNRHHPSTVQIETSGVSRQKSRFEKPGGHLLLGGSQSVGANTGESTHWNPLNEWERLGGKEGGHFTDKGVEHNPPASLHNDSSRVLGVTLS